MFWLKVNYMTTANDILDLYWDGYLPINPVDIAKQMGVNLISNSELEYSGHFRFTKDGTPTIEYNNKTAVSKLPCINIT